MNLFYLSHDPVDCAQQHCDKHVVKMIVESAQLLSTAHRMIDGFVITGTHPVPLVKAGRKFTTWVHPDDQHNSNLYKSSHVVHPIARWVRSSRDHYIYLWELTKALNDEFKYRYGHMIDHSTIRKLDRLLVNPPHNLESNGFIEPPQCMPDEYKNSSTISAYRNFYIHDKIRFATYTRRKAPAWYRPFLDLWHEGTNIIYEF